jgi:hypothetical protein
MELVGMKLILSRKGFDASSSGCPNAILPTGELCWFPIPDDCSTRVVTYDEIISKKARIPHLIEDLTRGRITGGMQCHLDPDLDKSVLPRLPGWLPAFGQAGAALAHLQGKGVAPGDVFLFFGWFREVAQHRGGWRYVPGSPDLHVIFGWLQVGQVFHVMRDAARIPKPLRSHPHYTRRVEYLGAQVNDAIYVARRNLDVPGLPLLAPGGGVFGRYSDRLRLTCPNQRKRSVWLLPRWMYPEGTRPALSYHCGRERWRKKASGVLLASVGRGQEFVLDCDYYPEAFSWLGELLSGL